MLNWQTYRELSRASLLIIGSIQVFGRHLPTICRAARKLPAVAILLLAGLLALDSPLPARSADPEAELHICPAEATPSCREDVTLPVGDRVTLDLLLTGGRGLAGGPAKRVVGWELHLELDGAAAIRVLPSGGAGRPVQERGDSRLFLEGFLHLPANARTADRRYYRVQNRYDPDTGRLDYSVILAGYTTDQAPAGIPPLVEGESLLLGRLELRGVVPGTVELQLADNAAPALLIAGLTSGSEIAALTTRAGSSTVDVVSDADPVLPPPALQGRVWAQVLREGVKPSYFKRSLTLTFWQAGSTPPWRGGTDRPLAIVAGLTADSSGRFGIVRLPPNVRPGETYDMRVKGLGTLSARAAGITIPTGNASPLRPLLTVDFSPLRDGDINGDNFVDRHDVADLRASFGTVKSDADFEPAADFNGDGVVDGQDFSRMAANFNQTGQ